MSPGQHQPEPDGTSTPTYRGGAELAARLPDLGAAGLSLGTDDLLVHELRNALWLSQHLDQAVLDRSPPAARPAPPDRPPSLDGPPPHAPPVGADGPPPAPPDRPASPAEATPGGLVLALPPATARPGRLVPGRVVSWLDGPDALAPLPDPRLIARSLRPLSRTRPSRRHRKLDVEKTAVRAAETGLWLPQWTPAQARSFDAVVVADDGASMAIWQHTVAAFRLLLERQGAFRDVRLVRLDTNQAKADSVSVRGESAVSGGVGGGRSPAELVDPSGRRLIFVLTDGVGTAWRTGAMDGWLRRWGHTDVVVVVNVLPQELWHWGGLDTRRVRLQVSGSVTANHELRYRLLERGEWPGALAVPVLELHPRWLARWARLVSAVGPDSVELPALLVAADPAPRLAEPVDRTEETASASPADRVLRFRTVASSSAFRLAGLLAAVPLNLSVMRLVQSTMLPGSRLSDLAEVFLSGLLTRTDGRPVGLDPYAVEFEFVDGVRAELLATGIRAETVRVLRLVSDYLGSRVAAMRNLRAALSEPNRTGDPEVSAESLPFIRVQQAALTALAGPYSHRARRLRERVAQSGEVSAVSAGEADNGQPADQPVGPYPDDAGRVSKLDPDTAPAVLGGGDVTTVDVANVPTSLRPNADLPTVWGHVPPRSVNFTGRDELLGTLRNQLVHDSAAVVLPEALHGLGGVGKTLLAVEYVYRYAVDYDLVWWIPGQDKTQIDASFVALAKRLGLAAENAGALEAVPAALEALRIGRPALRWLLVFDNANQPEDIRPLIPAGPGHILITSRNSQWSSIARSVEVDVFTRGESRQLLQRKCAGMGDNDAERIAEALGDLPLAVSQAGAWCAETGMSAEEYLRLFDDKRQELLLDRPIDYPVAVAAAWNVSLDQLAQHHPAALQLVRVCSFLSSEPISRSVFGYVRDATVPAELGQALGDPVKLGRAIRAINRYGLAKLDHTRDTLQFHRLVQAAVRDQMDPGQHDLMAHIAHRLLLNALPPRSGDVENWATCAQLLPHVRASRAADCDDSLVRMMVVQLVVYLINWGDPRTAAELAGELVTKWTAKLGESHPDTLAAARQLGVALRSLGRYREAREVHQRTYDLLRETVGQDHEETLVLGNLLARDLRAVGEFGEAGTVNAETYRRSLLVMGPNDPLTLASAEYFAASLRLLGDFAQARQLDEGSATRLVEVYGPDDRFALAARDRLAVDLRELGQYLDSRTMQEDTVVRYRKLFGDDHPVTYGAIKNLAVARRKAGDHQGALELSIEARDGLRRRSGYDHPEVLAAAMNLSIDLRQTGDLRSARELGTSTLQRHVQAFGQDHPYTTIGATNLAVTLRLLNDLDGARELNTEALQRLRARLGEDHPFTLVCATNLASDLYAAGEPQAAYELDTDTLVRSGDKLGADHPATLAVRLNLSLDLRALDRTAEADEVHGDVVTRLTNAVGAEHPATLAARQCVRADCDIEPLPF
ncbi:MAG TPA: FxSxx-COOH system tetratricopeptide repeat protein [Pseudonocardiaceae bacterium]|jgi:tetratricopeptide (TPR) repeat protein|nr:FxSxx-COOH system tetratricopeptide repeat protein [Pseudonocardiaceae bacterium]